MKTLIWGFFILTFTFVSFSSFAVETEACVIEETESCPDEAPCLQKSIPADDCDDECGLTCDICCHSPLAKVTSTKLFSQLAVFGEINLPAFSRILVSHFITSAVYRPPII